MPSTELVFFREIDGSTPFLDWFGGLQPRVQDKCRVRLERLQQFGHELRRPEADYLRDGIYELRIGFHGKNYRVLYFFHGREAVVISHGLEKEKAVPPKAIEVAIRRMEQFKSDPEKHTYDDE
jgi:phage-related protein